MANIWRKDDNVKEQPKRNIMDLSFQNNLTTQFGKLVPVFCKEFIPGDSFSIKPTFSLKFQPMVFPIQTRMRAHLHFFKVRNRNLWKDWEDFIAKNKENLDPPYLDTAVTQPTTGSLLDYLGVPTTMVGRYGSFENVGFNPDGVSTAVKRYVSSSTFIDFKFDSLVGKSISDILPTSIEPTDYVTYGSYLLALPDNLSELGLNKIRVRVTSVETSLPNNQQIDTYMNGSASGITRRNTIRLAVVRNNSIVYDYTPSESSNNGIIDYTITDALLDGDKLYLIFRGISNDSTSFSLMGSTSSDGVGDVHYKLPQIVGVHEVSYQSLNWSQDSVGEVVDIDETNSPYWRSGATADLRERIKLSALPCRAYEQIYNSFYRNAENNPYILNGVPEYNKYMPTDEGGVDANLYDFYYRNWEDDFLTTALQQPQAGIAPLVGLTGTAGTATVTLADADGNTSEATAQYDEEGTVTSVAFANNTSLTEALADAVTYGISINDLRNVNAFQRWLEAKARGGYKYRDVIETMFGISVRYDTLDMPEFIGGTSIDIMVNQISQTTPTESSPLGDYAGQAAGIGTGQTINEYFDEHGFVIGILSVVPVPNYSQLLPKHFIKRDAFDYYFPQFGHIGMQPIKYNEVCPVQSYQESTEQNNVLDQTFGYQRAWYDYLASTDEVHGEFRTNLRNFVMNRTFDVKPELVNKFLTVDPSQLNDVFAIQDDSYDKILGQIYFDVKAKRPIPLYGIPKLE